MRPTDPRPCIDKGSHHAGNAKAGSEGGNMCVWSCEEGDDKGQEKSAEGLHQRDGQEFLRELEVEGELWVGGWVSVSASAGGGGGGGVEGGGTGRGRLEVGPLGKVALCVTIFIIISTTIPLLLLSQASM